MLAKPSLEFFYVATHDPLLYDPLAIYINRFSV